MVAGLGCLISSQDAYQKTWDTLDSQFGDTRKYMNHFRQHLVAGQPIKDNDLEGFLKLGDGCYSAK